MDGALQDAVDPFDPASFGRLLQAIALAISERAGEEARQDSLQQVRAYFSAECVFVYELAFPKELALRENTGSFTGIDLPQKLNLEKMLPAHMIASLSVDQLYYCRAESNDEVAVAFHKLFSPVNMALMFVVDEEGLIIGCVGVVDTSSRRAPSSSELAFIEAALTPIAEKVRFRVFRQRLAYMDDALTNIMDHIGFDIYVNDYETHELLYANKSMAEPYGGWENMQGKPCYKALYDDKEEECEYCPKQHLIDEWGNPSKVYAWDYCRPFDGRWFRVICAAFHWVDGRLAQVISSTDINDAKENELLVEHMAYFDLLTGIPNRRKLEKDLDELIEQHRTDGSSITVLFLDLDGFKAVNDQYGHSNGDALLKHVSRLFSLDPLTAGRCYRYGGDEFIFVFEGVSAAQACESGHAIVKLTETPLELDGNTVMCSASFGTARYPENGTDYWELLDKADEAMYAHKHYGKTSEQDG